MTETYKQVLLHLDATDAASHRLRAAREIAQANGAAVSALYATLPGYIGLPSSGEMAASVAALMDDTDKEHRERARQVFDAACATPGPIPTWSETDEVPLAAAFAQQAFHADLLVLGQHHPSDPRTGGVPPDFAESVIVASGKPALVVPYIGLSGPIGDTVVIAWKPTRESARAVSAALPLLRQSRHVHVLTWGEPGQPGVKGRPLNLEGYLKLHGIEAIWHRDGSEPDAVGDLLLSRAFDLDADLLVMGCYGHSRARELVLGGASRTVLRSMTLPVLMAH